MDGARRDAALPGEVAVSEAGLAPYTFDLPADRLGDGHHVEIALAYDSWLVPAEIGQSADQRRLSVAVDWIQFTRGSSSPLSIR